MKKPKTGDRVNVKFYFLKIQISNKVKTIEIPLPLLQILRSALEPARQVGSANHYRLPRQHRCSGQTATYHHARHGLNNLPKDNTRISRNQKEKSKSSPHLLKPKYPNNKGSNKLLDMGRVPACPNRIARCSLHTTVPNCRASIYHCPLLARALFSLAWR